MNWYYNIDYYIEYRYNDILDMNKYLSIIDSNMILII